MKKEVVEDNLVRLEACKFDIPPEYTIPSSVQYVKKSVVHCPVDVEVYTQDGILITTLKDGEESDLTNEYGRFVVVRQSYDGEYAKVICQNTDEELVIKLKAVENGLVDFESSDAASIHTFDNLQVEAGDSVEIIGDSYTFDAKDDGEEAASGTLVEKDYDTYVRVENVSIEPTEVQLGCGEERVLDITITPENATNTTINWLSMDEDIAVVKNGVITGVSEGSTVVFAKMIDTEIEEIQIPVTVVGEEKSKYLITYDANGGQSVPQSQEKVQGQALKLTEDKPEKSYVITYDANGGSIGSGSKNIGCTFKNWNTKADGSGTEYNSGDEYTLDESVTLYAQWTEPVAGIMETPTRSGYTFDGWYTAVDGGSKVETSTVINGNMTLYAHWTAATYSVRYDANGGSGAPDAQEKIQDETQVLSSTRPTKTYKVTYNANVTNIESVSKDISCIFKNWNTQANGSGASYNSGEHYTENQDVTLYAQWENPKIGILTSPSRPGYIFDGWYTQLSGGTKVASSATVTGDMMLYAHWTKEVSKDPVEAFVSRLYKEILGRDADPSGLKAWVDVLKSGKEQGAKSRTGIYRQ